MKYIRRVSKVKNDDTKGYIINSTNVVDKEKNTYSANVIDGLTNIETVTDANGTAIKFPDGTLICRGIKSVAQNGSGATITFPVPFISTDYTTSLLNRYVNTPNITWSISAVKTTSIDIHPRDSSTKGNPSVETRADYIAIGRWKK